MSKHKHNWNRMSTVPELKKAPPTMPHTGERGQTIDILLRSGERLTNVFPYRGGWCQVVWHGDHTVRRLTHVEPIGWMHPPRSLSEEELDEMQS